MAQNKQTYCSVSSFALYSWSKLSRQTKSKKIYNRDYFLLLKSMEEKVDTTNVFVKFLPAEYGDSELAQLFSLCGKIISAKVMVETHTRKSLGYGYTK